MDTDFVTELIGSASDQHPLRALSAFVCMRHGDQEVKTIAASAFEKTPNNDHDPYGYAPQQLASSCLDTDFDALACAVDATVARCGDALGSERERLEAQRDGLRDAMRYCEDRLRVLDAVEAENTRKQRGDAA